LKKVSTNVIETRNTICGFVNLGWENEVQLTAIKKEVEAASVMVKMIGCLRCMKDTMAF